MNDVVVVIAATVLLISLSAFFVAAEFALLAAKKHRLAEAAPRSRSARAAMRSFNELTVLLAGCQLGITVCALGLGAVTKPAVHYALTPVLEAWGIAYWVADVAGFVLALIVVTFLHLVVGEMAPKSWAIAHPETAATMLALPMRAFMWVTRPVLVALNEMANACLRAVGVEPQDAPSSGRNADDLRHLVEHSANVGALDASYSSQLTEALELETLTVGDLLRTETPPTAVGTDATMADVRAATLSSGHLRILVRDGGDVVGVVHVRDTLSRPAEDAVVDVMRPPLRLERDVPVYHALTTMRETRTHLAVVTGGSGVAGVVTLADVLRRLFPASV